VVAEPQPSAGSPPDPDAVMAVLDAAAAAAGEALVAHRAAAVDARSLRRRGTRRGQYQLDLAVDAAVLGVLSGTGLGILSEESGRTLPGAPVVVVVDPVDGSTNASRGIPWYACSLCAVDADGPWLALVVNLATGTRYTARRGGGAERDGEVIRTSGSTTLADSLVVLNGHPPAHFGWRQYRALGATALDICAVADGSVDATIDCTHDALGPWDYLGAMLVLAEAGGVGVDALGRELVVLDHEARRTPVCAATPELLAQALAARGTG
jgi:fructose-1,6-bisphosphatase/inositol monophosphatase family enzyme